MVQRSILVIFVLSFLPKLGIIPVTAHVQAEVLKTLHVSPKGNDSNSGTQSKPFATVGQARDAVRSINQNMTGDIEVIVHGGKYALSDTLVFDHRDSGSGGHKVIYAAYKSEKPVLSGGRVITGWRPAERGVWKANLPEVKARKGYFRQLYVNGELRPRTRFPKEGINSRPGKAEPANAAFVYKPGELDARWSRRDDLEVIVLQFWTQARLKVASIDPAKRRVRFTGESWRPLTWSNGYYVENVYEALGTPGQWYLDRAPGTLYYTPLPGEDMSKAVVIAPKLAELVRLQGEAASGKTVNDVVFRGLEFAHAAWKLPPEGFAYPQAELPIGAALNWQGAIRCVMDGCRIANCDSWGIELGRGSKHCRIEHCTLEKLGAGGVKIGEPAADVVPIGPANRDFRYRPPRVDISDAQEASDNTVSDCILRDGAKSYFGAPAVWIGQSSANRVCHNEICGSWQFGVSVGWNWEYMPPTRTRDNLVEFNHVHHLDGGPVGPFAGIYTLGVQPGTVIRNNLVHHSTKGYGIGFDAGSTGILAENNVVHHMRCGLHFNWYCLGNIVQNNIFALNGEYQWTRYGDTPKKEDTNCNLLQLNVVYWNGGRLYRESKWQNYRMAIDYNLYWDLSGRPIQFLKMPLAEWQTKGLDQHSVVADPVFAEPDQDDFSLKPESPAWKLGFRPIDTSTIGPRNRNRTQGQLDSHNGPLPSARRRDHPQ